MTDDSSARRPKWVLATAIAVAGTVTGGGQEVQKALQPNVDLIGIPCGDIKATDFRRMTPAVVTKLIDAGSTAVHSFLDRGVAAIKPVAPSQVSTDRTQTLAAVAQHIVDARHHVAIAVRDTEWVFDLYSSLLVARLKGIRVSVAVPGDLKTTPKAKQQHETLQALGCEVSTLTLATMPPVQAFVCDQGSAAATAVVLSQTGLKIDARLLTAIDGDEDTINLVAASIHLGEYSQVPVPTVVLEPASEDEIIKVLRAVRQYSNGPTIEMRDVDLSLIDSWAKYAYLYKQTQQGAMLYELRSRHLADFAGYWVKYGGAAQSLSLPIVVEESPSGRCTVVNGLSRLLLLKRLGLATVQCAVISNVTAHPPALDPVKLSDVDVRVGTYRDTKRRYSGFEYGNVRKVEIDANRLQPITT